MKSEEIVRNIVVSLDAHKAQDICILKVGDITSLTEYFVFATGTSSTQVRSLADYVDIDLGKKGISPLHAEGQQTFLWTLLDYGEVVLHVFQKQTRDFYDLERLWKDGKSIDPTTFLGGTTE